ncbi:chondroitinase-B domain-containing protein [Chitinophaga caseinilytica]|uniref:Chondroitinase-B domain-containing protein n=1 Tax=Chitinophaga caseinilytica TaxID=2267521 RepID=A0ABZ2ZBR3_9BACT
MKRILPLVVLFLWTHTALHAAIIRVTSISALQSAINAAVPGDVIVLANGVYTTTGTITVNRQGTAAQPIIIAAETVGGVEINGAGGFQVLSPARYITITGFIFRHAAGKSSTAQGTGFVRLMHNVYETPGEGDNLNIQGNDHELSYCTFRNKRGLGQYVSIHGSGNGGSQVAQRIWVHHNYFYKQYPGGGNGSETIQFGLSGYSLSSSHSVVEYNLFEECDGENEGISVKASHVTLRYNTIRNNPAQFTLRHGNFCQVYGNYFIKTPGIRIFGDDHTIHSNYFDSCSIAINIGNGSAEVSEGGALTSHDRPDRVLIAFNTLNGNAQNIRQAARTDGLGSTYITGAYNIIQNSTYDALQIAGPSTGSVWRGNILHNVPAGIFPDTSYTNENPLLERDENGIWHLAQNSPAIGKGGAGYPLVTVDLDGQPRTSPMDAGADQFSIAPVKAIPLDSTMVGYLAGGDGPRAGITAPANGALIKAGDTVSIQATAISFSDTIARVEFYVDGVKVGEDSSAPYAFAWTAVYGQHSISVKAFDRKGRESATAQSQVTVNPRGTDVSLTSPVAGTVFVSPVFIQLSATASDSLGGIVAVSFYADTALIGTDSTAPYALRWYGPAAGNYSVTAKALNASGQTAISGASAIKVRIGNIDITDNGGTISGQYPNPSKPTEDLPSLIDNNPGTKYYRSGRTALWVQYKSTEPAIVVRYTITSGNDRPARDPRDWALLGSVDSLSWDTLDVRAGETFSGRGQLRSFDVAGNTKAYVYYRFNMTANNGEGNTQFAEWELFERRMQSIVFDSIGERRYGTAPLQLVAESTVGLPVTFSVVEGPAVLEGSQLTFTGPGTVTVKASAAGTDNYFPADTVQTFTVLKGIQTIQFPPVAPRLKYETIQLQASSSIGLPVRFALVDGGGILNGNSLKLTTTGIVTVRALADSTALYESASAEQGILVLGIGLIADPIGITIFPNPTRGPITVKLDNKKNRGYVFQVIDRMGNQVARTVIPQGQGATQVQFDLSSQIDGIYFLHVSDGVVKTVRAIMKY